MVPFFARSRTCARGGRYLFESFVETDDVNEAGAIAEPGDQSRATAQHSSGKSAIPQLQQRGEATASILAPPKDYEGIRLGPYKYIEWPDGEKELYDLERTPTSSTTWSASLTTSRSATSSTAN